MSRDIRREIEDILQSFVSEFREVDQSEKLSRLATVIYSVVLGRVEDLRWRRYEFHGIFRRLDELDSRQRELESSMKGIPDKFRDLILREALSVGPLCPLCKSRESADYSELIVDGGPSVTAKERGRAQADETLGDWVRGAVEVIAIDPFLFKREKMSEHNETAVESGENDVIYADALLDLLGVDKVVQFIYKGNPGKSDGGPIKVSQGVANRVADQISIRRLKVTFNVVEDLHDRVWLKRDAKGRWYGKVIGTSRGGIGRRPTCIIDMPQGDVDKYRSYVDYLIGVSQQSHERPIDFKKPRRPKARSK